MLKLSESAKAVLAQHRMVEELMQYEHVLAKAEAAGFLIRVHDEIQFTDEGRVLYDLMKQFDPTQWGEADAVAANDERVMKLFLLRPNWDNKEADAAFNEYDVTRGMVVRAVGEVGARAVASSHAGDEKRTLSNPWQNPEYTTCEELTTNGLGGLVLRDFAAG